MTTEILKHCYVRINKKKEKSQAEKKISFKDKFAFGKSM